MPEDLKLSQIGSSQLPPPFRGLHSPGVRKHCQIIFACYFRKSSITDKLFGDGADKAIKTARETFTIKNYHSGGQRPHPYKHKQNRPFLGQTPPPPPPPQYSQQGSYSSLRGRGKPWNQRGVGKFRGENLGTREG